MRKTVLRSVHWRKTCSIAREKRSTLANVDQGYPGQEAAQDDGMHLHVIRRKDATRGVVLPCRWVVARSVGWANRLRRLARDEAR